MDQKNQSSNLEEKNDKRLEFWVGFLIYGLTLLIFLLWHFGPGLIRTYKLKKEKELIFYGGSKKEAETSTKQYNALIEEIKDETNKIKTAKKTILVFTNDTSAKKAIIFPNLNYNVFDRGPFDFAVIPHKKRCIEELTNFLENKKNDGFCIKLSVPDHQFNLKTINDTTREYSYIVLARYYYSEKAKKHLKTRIEQKPSNHFSFLTTPKAEQLRKLEDEQFAKIIFSEKELQNNKIENKLASLLGPGIDLRNKSYKFYFSCQNDIISKQLLKDKTEKFKSMFLKNQNTSDCFIEEIVLQTKE